MNKKIHIRRKWAFEKGRNSSSILLAVLTVAVVLLLLVFTFEYEYKFQERKEQNTVMTMIDPALNTELFEIIDRRDSTHTYGTFGGSFSGLLNEHKYEVNIAAAKSPQIREYPSTLPSASLPETAFPVSIRYASIPAPEKKMPVTRVMTPDGRSIEIKALQQLKGKPQTSTMIRLSGREFLLRSELLRSCGDGELDKKTQNILKSAGVEPGIYLINWAISGERP